MMMSLSVDRPIVSAPAGCARAGDDLDGINAWNIFVARFPISGGLAELGDICVCGAADCGAADCGAATPGVGGCGWKLGCGGGGLAGSAGGRPPAAGG